MTLHLGWGEFQIGGGVLITNGRRGGFSSALTIRPSTRQAAVALSNSIQAVDDLAIYAVHPERPLRRFDPPPSTRLDEAVLDTYTGVYEFAPKLTIEITRRGNRLFGQVAGQGRFEMFPDRNDEFLVRVVAARIRFLKDDQGTIAALVLNQGGVEQRAKRLAK